MILKLCVHGCVCMVFFYIVLENLQEYIVQMELHESRGKKSYRLPTACSLRYCRSRQQAPLLSMAGECPIVAATRVGRWQPTYEVAPLPPKVDDRG
jgi:hypothetical protein